MNSFYRFPAMSELDSYSSDEQLAYIQGETTEAIIAWAVFDARKNDQSISKEVRFGSRTAYGMELMDVIHSCETALRMEFCEEEAKALCYLVINKNRKRGYYDEPVNHCGM